jgi:hypothetical protein
MAGRSKSTEPARMVRATLILFSMGPRAVQLGRWASRDSSLTPSRRKAGQALELLGSELSAKQAEADGVGKVAHASTLIRSKRNSSGRQLPDALAEDVASTEVGDD